ncbi:L-aspartate oxidase [bacterium]|nr:L-aspartate oxidase [bacterium]
MNTEKCDILIIGSGIAGLSFALEVADVAKIVVATKKGRADSATNYAQGGIAAAIGDDDSIASHIEDTIKTGDGFCREDVVNLVATEGPLKIRRLIEWGAAFSEELTGKLSLGREGGHTHHRIVHKADHTGKEVEKALLDQVRNHPNIELIEDAICVDLITDRHTSPSTRPEYKTCYGGYVFNPQTKKIDLIEAKITLMASGGMGRIWLNTTNPMIATGDGVAMSWRAGARIANLEFMQFHPTVLYDPLKAGSQSFLITEALRGFGGILRNQRGERFMEKIHPMAELAPRDVVARAIDNERKRWGIDHVWLDISHQSADEIRNRFPTIYQRLLEDHEIDMTVSPIPVVPAAHYQCGGVMTDTWGRTTICNLYAAGEVAYTGLHGANRLASNSLLEAVVFASRAAESARERLKELSGTNNDAIPPWDDSGTYDPEEWVLIAHDLGEIQKLMEDYVGIVRSDLRLRRAKRRISLITGEIEDYWRRTVVSPELVELRNIAQVARLVVRYALLRKESRGLHYTTDYPQKDTFYEKRDTVFQ